MRYKNQEIDFVKRTKEIIKQYHSCNVSGEKYEVTLLLNCFVGLLILPEHHWYDKLLEDIVSKEEWGISSRDISEIKSGEIKSVKNVARHMRNAISHYRFKALENTSKEIDKIKFEDFSNKNKTFEATLSTEAIKQFVTKLTDVFIKEMEK